MQNIQIFYRGPVMFIVTCFLVHPDCKNFLSEYWKSIIIQQLRGEELPTFLPLLQVDIFQEKQGTLQQINLCPSNKPEKACIRPYPCDTNNSTKILARMYQHTATESLYHLCGAKISWTPHVTRWYQIVSQVYLKNELSYEVSFLLVVKKQ